MRQINMREFSRGVSVARLREWMPLQIVSDGEIVAVVDSPTSYRSVVISGPVVRQPKGKEISDLPFSKKAQARVFK